MGYFKRFSKQNEKKHCAYRQYRKKNQIAHIRSSFATKSQVKDAYDLVYRQLLEQQKRGNALAVEQLEKMLDDFSNPIKQSDDQCILLNELCFNGDEPKKRWVKIKKIGTVQKTNYGTVVWFVNGGEMYVSESVNEVMKLIRER